MKPHYVWTHLTHIDTIPFNAHTVPMVKVKKLSHSAGAEYGISVSVKRTLKSKNTM